MIKQTISFTDYNGVQRTEDHYFNLTKAELFKMEVTADGNSLYAHLEKLQQEMNGKDIMETFEKILSSAYGVRSEDGRRFMKSPELYKDFSETEAYSEFFYSIVTDADKMSAFVNGLMPHDLKASPETVADIQAKTLAEKGGFNKPTPKDMKVVSGTEVDTVNANDAHKPDVAQLTREQLEARLHEMSQSDLK